MLTDYSLKTMTSSYGNPPVNLAWTIINSLTDTTFPDPNKNCGDFLLSPVIEPVNGYSQAAPVAAGFITSTVGNP
jgi:hypothetical protein